MIACVGRRASDIDIGACQLRRIECQRCIRLCVIKKCKKVSVVGCKAAKDSAKPEIPTTDFSAPIK